MAATARAGDGQPVLPRTAIFAIASVANGLGPLALVEVQWHGLQFVIDLFRQRSFPERMTNRLRAGT